MRGHKRVPRRRLVKEVGARNVTHGFRVYRALDASCVIAHFLALPVTCSLSYTDYVMMM